MNVFDSSALLAFLQNEDGADVVEKALLDGGVCAAANWSEVAQKVIAHDRDWQLSAALLSSYGIEVEPVGRADAEYAASLWFPGKGLALADRLCLAVVELALRVNVQPASRVGVLIALNLAGLTLPLVV